MAARGSAANLLEIYELVLQRFLQSLHDSGRAELAPGSEDLAAAVRAAGKDPGQLPDGSVVIAYPGGGVIYPPNDRVNACATLFIPADAGDPIDICRRGDGGFAILSTTGKLVVFSR